jgi:environmental stress-induced protein Ves
MHRLIPHSSYQVKAWKNGGGSTAEIAILKSDCSENFLWRLSLAELNQSGPFSSFPGRQRVITLISGPPVILKHQHLTTTQTLKIMQPYEFSGAWMTEAMVSGPGKDFNVMWDPEKIRAIIKAQHLSPKKIIKMHDSTSHLNETAAEFIFCAEGPLLVDGILLKSLDTLQLKRQNIEVFNQNETPSHFLTIQFLTPSSSL